MKKQQPISMPEPPGSSRTGSISGSRSETFVENRHSDTFVGATSMDSGQPIVAVTVHECNSETISHLWTKRDITINHRCYNK